MSALPLFDVMLLSHQSASNGASGRITRLAEQLVESMLAELKQIEAYDACIAPIELENFNEQVAILLRGMYEQWVRDADAVLRRIAELQRHGLKPANIEKLNDAQGRTLAMLSVTPQDIKCAKDEARSGRTRTLEEVRRELRIGVH